MPPLYDVVLIAPTGEVWTLAGYERVTSGALQQEYFLGQSWVVTPAPLEDLRKSEAEWAKLAELPSSKARWSERGASLTSFRGLTMDSAEPRLLVRSKDRRLTVHMAS